MPDDEVLASMSIDNVKIDKLVHEFLEAQSLKILPQAQFDEAVTEFVIKNEIHAIDVFVADSLSEQVKELLKLDQDADEEDIAEAMEARKAVMEDLFNKGNLKLKRKVKYKPRPSAWDSDLDGEWEEHPEAMEIVDGDGEEDVTPAPPKRRGRISAFDDDDDDDDMESVIEAPVKKAPAKKAPAKKAPAKTTKAKAPAKKTPAAKAPARGRKKAVISDDDDDDDVIMLDEEPAPKKTQPKRAAATRVAGASAGTRQTQLTFSQTPKATQRTELSEDEISDDDDAFAPAVSQQSSRARR